MSSTTVAEFANELKKSADVLLDQLRSAGVAKASDSDVLTDADKQKLLSYLQASHGTVTADRKKITLVKKSTSEIKQADASGKARTIQVEVRKKRTLIKRDDEPQSTADEPAVDHADLARREEDARHQAELIRLQEEELAQSRRLREAQEAQQRAELAAQEAQAAAKALADAETSETAQKPTLSRADREQLARAEAASINAASQAKPAAAQASE
ncbi:MAG: translation initiation factor IF-2 associated domain-containing protein, partial [Limnohabitans sp.]|uniref:translation initiation factor IF-2 associated domain-containing protein n=1 Tax=Limnohabitans sp. TaxID=1907725 RepID=UPI00391D348B